MQTVYVVQELTRYHCPKCNGTDSKRVSRPGEPHEYQCQRSHCGQRYNQGVLRPVHSLTEAAAFGRLEILLKQHLFPVNMQPIKDELEQKLQNFEEGDYILPVGDPTVSAIATAIAAKKTNKLNFLRWDRQTRQYIEVKVEL